jgi:hypothetical protein
MSGAVLPGVSVPHNAPVRMRKGAYALQVGSTISLETLGDDPCYLVELADGRDVLVSQSELEIVEA